MAACMLQQHSWVAATETFGAAKPKIFTNWFLQKKFVKAWIRVWCLQSQWLAGPEGRFLEWFTIQNPLLKDQTGQARPFTKNSPWFPLGRKLPEGEKDESARAELQTRPPYWEIQKKTKTKALFFPVLRNKNPLLNLQNKNLLSVSLETRDCG